MKIHGKLLKALVAGQQVSGTVEATYRNGKKVSGFIQNITTNPDVLVIGRNTVNPGENVLHPVNFDELTEIKVDSVSYLIFEQ